MFVTLKSIILVLLQLFRDMYTQIGKNLESPDLYVPSWGWIKWFSVFWGKDYFFAVYLVLFFFLVISLFKVAPKLTAKVLCRFLSARKLRYTLWKKIHVLNKLSSGTRYNTVGCEFSINDSKIYSKYSVFKQKHT